MKRLLIISLLILTFSANALAGAFTMACAYSISPASTSNIIYEAEPEHHKNHAASAMIIEAEALAHDCAQMPCDTAVNEHETNQHDCGNCQHHCTGSALLQQLTVTNAANSATNPPFYLSTILPTAPQRLLRPPRLA